MYTLKPIFKRPYLLFAFTALTAVVINSCKKDSRAGQQNTVSDPAIAQAKSWYERTYPINTGKAGTQSINSNHDFSQIIKPDWDHTLNYTRNSDSVVEIPLGTSSRLSIGIKKTGPRGQTIYNPKNGHSTLLILKKGNITTAYIMTVIADSSYLKNDITKLDRNRYNKKDNNFSGVALYSTPNGKFVSAWFYESGKLVTKLPIVRAPTRPAVQSISTSGIKTMNEGCTEWVQEAFVDGEAVDTKDLDSTCPPNDIGGGTGSGDFGPEYDNGGFPNPGDGSTPSGGVGVNEPSVTNSDIANAIPIDDGNKPIDPTKYINCFTDGKTAKGYKLTIYVQQPIPGKNDQFDLTFGAGVSNGEVYSTPGGTKLDVGHTFVSFTKLNTDGTFVTQVMGFYPTPGSVISSSVSSKGVVKDDSGHEYNVSYSMDVSGIQFNLALSRLTQDYTSANYILSNLTGTERNCADAAISWMTVGGANLPTASRGVFSNTPGDFGQALANVQGASTTSGVAPQSHGPCN